MKFNLIDTKEILDVEQELGHELVVSERPKHMNLPKFYVSFRRGEIIEDGMLVSEFGDGNTVDEALQNYCELISNRRITFGGFNQNRKEILLPNLIHTKLLNK